MREIHITPKDTIGYIRRLTIDDKTQFRWIETKVKKVVIGKTKTSVYSDRFYTLDAEEIESNTDIMTNGTGLVIVNEPFITNPELTEKCKKTVDYWNEYGAKGVLD